MTKKKHPMKMAERQRRHRYARRRMVIAVAIASVVIVFVLADKFGFLGSRPTPDRERYHDKTFKVVNVVDGDTIDIDLPDEKRRKPTTRIRLWGVDTPETVKPKTPPQHFGPEASAFTRKVALGQEVRLELEPRMEPGKTRDRYGRLLAHVFLPDNRLLSGLLIEEGYGYADPRYDHSYKKAFGELQKQAHQQSRGLWKDVIKSDQPYYMRNANLSVRDGNVAAKTQPQSQ